MRKFVLICISFLSAIGLVAARPLVVYGETGFDYDNYYQLEYIETSGTQYINTNYVPFNYADFSLVFDVTPLNTPNSAGLFSANKNTNTYQATDNRGNFYWLFNNKSVFTNYQLTSNRTTLTFSRSNGVLSYSDSYNNVSATYNESTTFNSEITLFYSYGSYLGRYRIYSISMSAASSTFAILIPAERKSDGVIGLYNTKNSTFLTNNGSGSFVSGPRVSITQYTITTSVSPSGSGTVTGGGTYDSGSVITLSAAANNGYSFSSWSDGNTDNPRSITVTSNQSFQANFVADSPPSPTQYTITTSVSPSGSGTVTGGGTYDYGSNITLTANASDGYQFASWSDGITTNPRTLQVTSNLNLVAYFTNDISNQIVLGTNIHTTYYVDGEVQYVTGWQQNGNFYNAYTYSQDMNYDFAQYQFDVVLNKEYTGYLYLSFHFVNHTDWSYVITVYVNGSVGTGYFNFRGRDNVGSFGQTVEVDSYITNNLTVKQSSSNALYEGTQESVEINNNFNDSNDDFNSMASDMFALENGFNEDLNDSLDDIDPDFSFDTGFGSGFLHSAQFVKDEFDFLTQNNAFGSLLSFSLLFGLGLLILGKIL